METARHRRKLQSAAATEFRAAVTFVPSNVSAATATRDTSETISAYSTRACPSSRAETILTINEEDIGAPFEDAAPARTKPRTGAAHDRCGLKSRRDRVQDRGDVGTDQRQGGDRHDRDQGQDQGVLDQRLTVLAVPHGANELEHVCSPPWG